MAWQRATKSPGGRIYTPPATRAYQAQVAFCSRATRKQFGRRKVAVEIAFYVSYDLRGDIDNYIKSIMDGMQKGGIIDNDRQIRHIDAKVHVVHGDPEATTVTVSDL